MAVAAARSLRAPLVGPAVWTGAEMAAATDWIHPLSAAMLREIDAAVVGVVARGLDWRRITPADFPLPATAPLLAQVAETLESGRGMAKITGLELARYSQTERRALYFGICCHLGTAVSMSRDGMIMSDVTDEGAAAADRYGKTVADGDRTFLSSRARVHSTGELRYHNDRADVVALLCVAKARSGGLSRLVSVPRVHNEMLAHRPDLLELLFQPYCRSRLGEEFGDNRAWYALPVFAMRDGCFTSHYSRTYIEAAQLNESVPRMRPEQWEAIELMVRIADEVAFETMQEPGEIQLLNNHVVFHSRTAYEDDPEPARRRLLHRLWLATPNSRPLPDSFAVLFRDVRPGVVRGGIPQAPAGPGGA